MKRTSLLKSALSILLTLCLILSMLASLVLYATAAPSQPRANSKPRHVVCTSLSSAAQSYYTGTYSYVNLSQLSGASATYSSYVATQNNPLYTALQTLMSNTHTYQTSYSGWSAGSLAYYWQRTDAVSSGSTFVMFYGDVVYNSNLYTMNREHVWPKSRASFYQEGGGADLHHLRPSIDTLNSDKSDHTFGNARGYSDTVAGIDTTGYEYWYSELQDLFECKDDVKGDVARILLYVYCRWGQPNLYSQTTSSNLPAMDADDSYNNGKKVIESLDTLLQWCKDDPVDTWEMERNDLTQQVQGNRNVFIDYPELAWKMFGRSVPTMTTPSGSSGCNHNYRVTSSQAATCTTAGTIVYTCSKCGDQYTETVAALGHVDANGDSICDRCGENCVEYTLTTVLKNGDSVVIVNAATNKALSSADLSASQTGYRAAIDVVPNGNRLDHPNEALIWEVESIGSSYRFKNNSGYLSAPSGSNNLTLSASEQNWNVVVDSSSNTVAIISTTSVRNGVYRAIEYYSTYNEFTTYAPNGGNYSDSAFQMNLYVYSPPAAHVHSWNQGVITTSPGCTTEGIKTYTCTGCGETYTEPVPAAGHSFVNGVCTVCGEIRQEYALATSLQDGDRVVIYNAANSVALSNEAHNTNYRAGAAVTIDGGKVISPVEALVWTVEENNGAYKFKDASGQYLSVGSYNQLLLDSTYTEWNVSAAATADSVYIVSTGSQGTGGDYRGVEYYGGHFTTYYASETNIQNSESAFAMQFYVLQTPALLRGDVNRDGTVSIEDVTVLLNALTGQGEEDYETMDLDESGTLSIGDVTELLNILANV